MTLRTASFLMASLCKPGWDIFLDTLRGQTVGPNQIVVVVDRPVSDDEMTAFQETHPDVDFVFNTKNLGVAISANNGLRHCTGDVVFRIDDDDACDPRRVELQLKALNETGAEISATFGRGIRGAPRKDFETNGQTGSWMIECPQADADLKTALLSRNVLVHSSIAMRRDAFQSLGGYDESFRYALDYALYLNALQHGMTFAVVPEPLVTRFYVADSITLSKRKQQIMFSTVARLLYAAHQDKPIDFLKVIWKRTLLLATPNWLRHQRRRLFSLIGRGA